MVSAARRGVWMAALMGSALVLAACSGGGGGDSSTSPNPPPVGSPPPPPPPPPVADSRIFETELSTARFLTQATFGPREAELTALTGTSASDWFSAELAKPPSLFLPYTLDFIASPRGNDPNSDGLTYEGRNAPTFAFWTHAVAGEDQLRQRMAYALSQILVISHLEGNELFEYPEAVAAYQDILVTNAFGNYRDLMEEVTYAPAMAQYLTYLQNMKSDPKTGRMPDENYAREIMQLFTIGLNELNDDGTLRLSAGGQPIPNYDNDDVQGLARVFTGLSVENINFYYGFYEASQDAKAGQLVVFPEFHSELEKSFLGTTVSAGTDAETSIDIALDTLFADESLPPFIARQLIQRFVTSNPEPAYVARVANAFETGTYRLPDNSNVGTGERGDLAATLAAILMDEEARSEAARDRPGFGKVREPVIRFINWARAFDAGTVTPEDTYILWNTSGGDQLSQHPYKSPSVFNFYRPGFVAPGTESGAAGMTVPELQIVNTGSMASYTNFMTYFTFMYGSRFGSEREATSFFPDYSEEVALAETPDALVSHLSNRLAYGELTDTTRQRIVDAIQDVPISNPFDPEYDGAAFRVSMATLMVMTSPEFLVQR